MFLLIAALAVVVAACGSDSKEGDNKEKENETSENTGAEGGSEKVEGSVVIDGSGTVYPLMAKLAEEYM